MGCDGATAETIPIEVKAKPPRKQKSEPSHDNESSSKRRKTSQSSHAAPQNNNFSTSEPMLNALRQIESNQLHILQRISSLEQLVHRVLPLLTVPGSNSDSPSQRTRAPLVPGQVNMGPGGHSGAPTSGNPDSMGLDSLCARILEQQNGVPPGSISTDGTNNPQGGVPSGLVQDSGSIGGWIQDSLSALTWNLNKMPRSSNTLSA